MSQTKTKIYATVGPSCSNHEIIEKMIEQGLTGVRLNLSHTDLVNCEDILEQIHKAYHLSGKKPEILIDMQGPEMRIGTLNKKIMCKEGEMILFFSDTNFLKINHSVSIKIPVQQKIFEKFQSRQKILLDDGKLLLEITETSSDAAIAIVKRGGILTSRKSIAIEGFISDLPALTKSDQDNIALAKQYGITGLMQPFVRNGDDLCQVRDAISMTDTSLRLFAKIENQEGIDNLETIIPNADEIIIARGDLGNAVPLWELPVWQRKIGDLCKKTGKPFMIVTQMLSSMEHCAVPTRAEVSDIFHAVADGASSVMVTGETAIGSYPVEVIRYLSNTCKAAEAFLNPA